MRQQFATVRRHGQIAKARQWIATVRHCGQIARTGASALCEALRKRRVSRLAFQTASAGSKVPSTNKQSSTSDRSTSISIRRAAMNLLARREHSFQELISKLQQRFSEHPDLLMQELHNLTEEGLQSDLRMVEAFVRSRINKGQGPVKISAELRTRGISDTRIEQGILNAEVDWFELIEQVATRKFGDSRATDLREKGRRARFLQQRGFSFEQISKVLD
jgi:regulatory protein